MITIIIFLIGFGYLLKLAYSIALMVRIHLVKLDKDWMSKFGKQPWAIVTGCTGGIGKQYCMVLSKLGFNIIMIARNQVVLKQLKQEIQQKYKRQCKYIIINFEQATYQQYTQIEPIIKQLNVRMLVNNVGFPSLNEFQNQTHKQISNQIRVNIESATILTKICIPFLIKNTQSSNNSFNRSSIINMSSMSIQLPFSSTPIYVATKSYNDSFSQSLNCELNVLSVRASVVSTPATRYSKQIVSISPTQCVQGSLKSLGIVQMSHGHILHNLQSLLIDILGYRLCKLIAYKRALQVREEFKKKD